MLRCFAARFLSVSPMLSLALAAYHTNLRPEPSSIWDLTAMFAVRRDHARVFIGRQLSDHAQTTTRECIAAVDHGEAI